MEKTGLKGIRNITKLINQALAASTKAAFDIEPRKIPLQTLYKDKKGQDFQSAFGKAVYNQFKKKNETIAELGSGTAVAQKVLDVLKENHSDLVSEATVNQKGFTFLRLSEDLLLDVTRNILTEGVHCADHLGEKPEKVLIDFSGPNIAKELHVGHIRATIQGETVCRFFEYLGYKVDRVNHLGDWGTQFGMLISHLFDEYPDALENMPDLSDLEEFYVAAKKRFKEDPEFKKRSQLMVVQLQSGEDKAIRAWKVICAISRSFFTKIYERLHVTIEDFGESFYNPMIPSLLEELESKNLIKIDDGAKCLFVPGFKHPLFVQKRDGGFGYDTTDLCASRYRLTVVKAQRVIILTDLGQRDHIKMIFKASEMAGWFDPNVQRCDHLGFGLIQKADGSKMSTSDGRNVKLVDLLDEARDRSLKQLKDRLGANEDNKTKLEEDELLAAAEIMGTSAVKYYEMRQKGTQNYRFDYDKILNPKGDTAVYLLYTYARLCSLVRRSELTPEELQQIDKLKITHDIEKMLMSHLAKFPDLVDTVAAELCTHKLCAYTYDLACSLSTALGKKDYKIIEKDSEGNVVKNDESHSRILVIEACRKMMNLCFSILAITPLERI